MRGMIVVTTFAAVLVQSSLSAASFVSGTPIWPRGEEKTMNGFTIR